MNLEGEGEPGVSGRAQNVRFPPFWADPLNHAAPLPCAKRCHLFDISFSGTPEAPEEINDIDNIGHLWSHHVSYTSTWSQNWSQSGTI